MLMAIGIMSNMKGFISFVEVVGVMDTTPVTAKQHQSNNPRRTRQW
jgi:hypothetical protein